MPSPLPVLLPVLELVSRRICSSIFHPPDYAMHGQRPQCRKWRGPARLWCSTSCSAACAKVSDRDRARHGHLGDTRAVPGAYRGFRVGIGQSQSCGGSIAGRDPMACSSFSFPLTSLERGSIQAPRAASRLPGPHPGSRGCIQAPCSPCAEHRALPVQPRRRGTAVRVPGRPDGA